MKKVTGTRLLAVVPWNNEGHEGWVPGGISAYFEDLCKDGSTVIRMETVYLDDLTDEERLAWRVGILVREPLERRFGGRQGELRLEAAP